MKAAWMERFGDPAEVVTTRELPDPDAAGRDEVLLDLVASPINPADFFLIQGVYAILHSPEQINAMFGELITEIGAGALRADVEATYPLAEVHAALDHATRSGRAGKVLLTGPGL